MKTFFRYGQEHPPAKLIPLRAGPLALSYDPSSGMLRRIKLGDVEVIRGIYAAVRDCNWGTVPARLRETEREVAPQSFHIAFEAEHREGSVHFSWQGVICGDADGSLRYEFDGVAKQTFLRNRIGFCILHPIHECAGRPATQFRVDGTQVRCQFPELIEPQIFGRSSFQQLCGIAHEVAHGITARVDFAGDTFEMEDQRNWTDASFKTYCTPLALPFPVEIRAGSRVRQVVNLRLSDAPADLAQGGIEVCSSRADPIKLMVPNAPALRLPSLGLGIASDNQALTEKDLGMLAQLRLSHLRVDLRMSDPNSLSLLARASREASQLGARLELAVHMPRAEHTDPLPFLRVLERSGVSLARILALRDGEPATSPNTLAWVQKYFGMLGAPIGAGSDCNFCELNRENALGNLGLNGAEFLFWPICPQVHAFDHLSLLENLEAQEATARSARVFGANRPVVVSPVTLRQRFNPVATSGEKPVCPGELPPQVDPRQMSAFLAAWTLGSVAVLAAAGVNSVTYFETVGWRGVMQSAAGSPLPEKFPAEAGALFPVFSVFTDLAGFNEIVPVVCSESGILSAVGLFENGVLRCAMVANLTDTNRTASLAWPSGGISPLALEPYQVIKVPFLA